MATADFAEARGLDSERRRDDAGRFSAALLMQDRDVVVGSARRLAAGEFPKVVTSRAPTAEEWTALRFAWRVCGHVKSNAVIFTDR